jgi:1,4-dihydroxy-2-naphthoate octaprenyltransferase
LPGIWFLQARGPFLILAVVLVLAGAAMAFRAGCWNWLSFVLLLAGVVGAHASVNLFNELSDYQTGIDRRTRKTPFSGGSGLLVSGTTSPGSVRIAAYGLMAFSGLVGVYFCFKAGWIILPFMLLGGFAVRFYTSYLARYLLGEIFSGLTLGTLVILGTYYSLCRDFTPEVLFLSIPPGILTSLLLFLNEIPDAEADKAGGRRHLVIHLGKRKSAVVYTAGLAAVYGLILLAPVVVHAPLTVWLGLLTIPLAIKASMTALKEYDHPAKFVSAQGANTLLVLLTDLLLAAGYFLKPAP